MARYSGTCVWSILNRQPIKMCVINLIVWLLIIICWISDRLKRISHIYQIEDNMLVIEHCAQNKAIHRTQKSVYLFEWYANNFVVNEIVWYDVRVESSETLRQSASVTLLQLLFFLHLCTHLRLTLVYRGRCRRRYCRRNCANSHYIILWLFVVESTQFSA